MIPFLPPNVSTGIAAVAIAAALIAGGWGYVQHQRAERYQSEADQAVYVARALSAAAQSKDQVIARQLDAAKRMLDTIAEQQHRIEAAGARITELSDEILARGRRLRELEETDRENPECKAILDTVLDDVCPGVARGVRERAADRLQGSDR